MPSRNLKRYSSALCSLVALLILGSPAVAQLGNSVPARITQSVSDKQLVLLPGNVHPLARPEFDQGPVADAQPLRRMLLHLQRSPEQETALQQFLDQQQTKSSPNYQAWLTPEQFGRQFGLADADLQIITQWLASKGFTDIKVGPGRSVIEFSGNVAQVRTAFHTQMHRFAVNNEEHIANASDPQIPAALAPVVSGIVSLHNFPRKSHARYPGEYQRSTASSKANPLFTFPTPGGSTFFGVGPSDFAKIYNVQPLWDAGIDGTGQTIAIVAETNINLQDVRDFRNIFGLPVNDPQIVLNGEDPGITSVGEESEADLDVQWSGAIAKNATVKFVLSASTPVSSGVDLSALYIVENNLAAVMSESYGQCELGLGATGNQFFSDLWKQAAAQGITVVLSSGDGGSAGCDNFDLQQTATHGLAVSGFASTPYNVSVGGTDFDQINKWTQFWNNTNDPNTQLSAKGYIPEIPWNQTCSQLGLTGCGSTAPQGSVNIVAGSGGPSSIYAKPSWQIGVTGMPNDNHRDQPDISLFASPGFTGSGYIICQQDKNTSGIRACDLNTGTGFLDFHGIGGTSASAPAFAGIMALVNHKQSSAQVLAPRQGNANYVLYALAKKANASCTSSATPAATCTFYDVTKGNTFAQLAPGIGTNSVPCTGGSLNCSVTTAGTNGVLVDPAKATTEAWTATAGYDLVTGLGSVNAFNLATNWSTVNTTPTTTTLALNPTTSIMHGSENVAVTINVTPAAATGNVALLATLPDGSVHSVGVFTLTNGTVSVTTSDIPGGSSKITAHYAGDGTFAPSDSAAIPTTVNPETSKTFIVVPTFDSLGNSTSTNSSSFVYGTPFFIRMYVANSSATPGVNGLPGPLCADVDALVCPSGSISLLDNGSAVGQGTFALNNAAYTRDLIPAVTSFTGGTHTLVAHYSGDNSYSASSATDTITITPVPSPVTVFIESMALVGQPVQLEASADPPVRNGVTPTGTFTFFDGGTPLAGTVTTSASTLSDPEISGFLTFTFTSPGVHNITARYSGDSNYAATTSASSRQIITQYPVTIAVTIDPPTVLLGNPVNLTATVTSAHATPALAGNALFNVNLNGPITSTLTTDTGGNQILKLTATATPPASEFISLVYNNDPNYADNSNGTSVIVNIPDFTVTPAAPFNVPVGQSGSVLLNVVPASNNPSPVQLACNGNVPVGYTCSVQPGTVNLANGVTSTATLMLSTQPIPAALLHHSAVKHSLLPLFFTTRNGPWLPLAALSGIMALCLICWPGQRTALRRGLGFTLACVCALLIGCGGGGSNGGTVGGGGGGNVGPFTTTTTIETSASKVAVNGSITFTAKVTGQGNPTGTVDFFISNRFAGNVPLANGSATFTTNLSFPGIYGVSAQYQGDAQNIMSGSPTITESVTGTTTVQITANTSTLFHFVNVDVNVQ